MITSSCNTHVFFDPNCHTCHLTLRSLLPPTPGKSESRTPTTTTDPMDSALDRRRHKLVLALIDNARHHLERLPSTPSPTAVAVPIRRLQETSFHLEMLTTPPTLPEILWQDILRRSTTALTPLPPSLATSSAPPSGADP